MSSQSSTKNTLLGKHKRSMTDILWAKPSSTISREDNDAGWTQFHQKVYKGDLSSEDIADLPKDQIDVRDRFGQSPMWIACAQCNSRLYKLLRDNGSDLKQKDIQERSLAHAIASGNSRNCASIAVDLVEHGVSFTDKDIMGNTPIEDLRHENSIVNYETDILNNNRRLTLAHLKVKFPNMFPPTD